MMIKDSTRSGAVDARQYMPVLAIDRLVHVVGSSSDGVHRALLADFIFEFLRLAYLKGEAL